MRTTGRATCASWRTPWSAPWWWPRAGDPPADFRSSSRRTSPRAADAGGHGAGVHIERVLRETQHNLSRAARILDIDRTTLYNKLRRYGLR
jgi:transcriptional regulator of acetoin/glycerol metabolism